MARRLRDPKTDKIIAIEMSLTEMASALGTETEMLQEWPRLIPPYSGMGASSVYRVASVKELNHLKKRVALLRTHMSEEAVANVEKAGLLDSYAALAEDCPKGITAHVWRSYALIVLMQIRYGKMIGAKELAERAGLTEIDPETGKARPNIELAEKHIRLLMSVGPQEEADKWNTVSKYLQEGKGEWEGQWEHKGLPKAWRGA
jgi:hypothetical protein